MKMMKHNTSICVDYTLKNGDTKWKLHVGNMHEVDVSTRELWQLRLNIGKILNLILQTYLYTRMTLITYLVCLVVQIKYINCQTHCSYLIYIHVVIATGTNV